MRLNADQVNRVKTLIESNPIESLYKRLEWSTPKTIRLSLNEKYRLQEIAELDSTSPKDKNLLKELIRR